MKRLCVLLVALLSTFFLGLICVPVGGMAFATAVSSDVACKATVAASASKSCVRTKKSPIQSESSTESSGSQASSEPESSPDPVPTTEAPQPSATPAGATEEPAPKPEPTQTKDPEPSTSGTPTQPTKSPDPRPKPTHTKTPKPRPTRTVPCPQTSGPKPTPSTTPTTPEPTKAAKPLVKRVVKQGSSFVAQANPAPSPRVTIPRKNIKQPTKVVKNAKTNKPRTVSHKNVAPSRLPKTLKSSVPLFRPYATAAPTHVMRVASVDEKKDVIFTPSSSSSESTGPKALNPSLAPLSTHEYAAPGSIRAQAAIGLSSSSNETAMGMLGTLKIPGLLLLLGLAVYFFGVHGSVTWDRWTDRSFPALTGWTPSALALMAEKSETEVSPQPEATAVLPTEAASTALATAHTKPDRVNAKRGDHPYKNKNRYKGARRRS